MSDSDALPALVEDSDSDESDGSKEDEMPSLDAKCGKDSEEDDSEEEEITNSGSGSDTDNPPDLVEDSTDDESDDSDVDNNYSSKKKAAAASNKEKVKSKRGRKIELENNAKKAWVRGDFSTAESLYATLIEMGIHKAKNYSNRAACNMKLGEWDDVIKCSKDSIDLIEKNKGCDGMTDGIKRKTYFRYAKGIMESLPKSAKIINTNTSKLHLAFKYINKNIQLYKKSGEPVDPTTSNLFTSIRDSLQSLKAYSDADYLIYDIKAGGKYVKANQAKKRSSNSAIMKAKEPPTSTSTPAILDDPSIPDSAALMRFIRTVNVEVLSSHYTDITNQIIDNVRISRIIASVKGLSIPERKKKLDEDVYQTAIYLSIRYKLWVTASKSNEFITKIAKWVKDMDIHDCASFMTTLGMHSPSMSKIDDRNANEIMRFLFGYDLKAIEKLSPVASISPIKGTKMVLRPNENDMLSILNRYATSTKGEQAKLFGRISQLWSCAVVERQFVTPRLIILRSMTTANNPSAVLSMNNLLYELYHHYGLTSFTLITAVTSILKVDLLDIYSTAFNTSDKSVFNVCVNLGLSLGYMAHKKMVGLDQFHSMVENSIAASGSSDVITLGLAAKCIPSALATYQKLSGSKGKEMTRKVALTVDLLYLLGSEKDNVRSWLQEYEVETFFPHLLENEGKIEEMWICGFCEYDLNSSLTYPSHCEICKQPKVENEKKKKKKKKKKKAVEIRETTIDEEKSNELLEKSAVTSLSDVIDIDSAHCENKVCYQSGAVKLKGRYSQIVCSNNCRLVLHDGCWMLSEQKMTPANGPWDCWNCNGMITHIETHMGKGKDPKIETAPDGTKPKLQKKEKKKKKKKPELMAESKPIMEAVPAPPIPAPVAVSSGAPAPFTPLVVPVASSWVPAPFVAPISRAPAVNTSVSASASTPVLSTLPFIPSPAVVSAALSCDPSEFDTQKTPKHEYPSDDRPGEGHHGRKRRKKKIRETSEKMVKESIETNNVESFECVTCSYLTKYYMDCCQMTLICASTQCVKSYKETDNVITAQCPFCSNDTAELNLIPYDLYSLMYDAFTKYENKEVLNYESMKTQHVAEDDSSLLDRLVSEISTTTMAPTTNTVPVTSSMGYNPVLVSHPGLNSTAPSLNPPHDTSSHDGNDDLWECDHCHNYNTQRDLYSSFATCSECHETSTFSY